MIRLFETHPVLLVIITTLITVLGDSAIKKASTIKNPFGSNLFALGLGVYAGTAFLWLYIFKNIKFTTSGALYSISTMFFAVFFGLVVFRETLTWAELLGLFLAMVSFGLLSKQL